MTFQPNDPRALANRPDAILTKGAARTLLYRFGLHRGRTTEGWTEAQLAYLIETTTGETLFDMLFELLDEEIERTGYGGK